MGRKTLLAGLISAAVGFVTAGTLSNSHLPAWLVFALCPAGLLGWLVPTADPDAGFLWSVCIINAVIYGLVGITLGLFFRVDNE